MVDKVQAEQENRAYIVSKIDPIFEDLVRELTAHNPEDYVLPFLSPFSSGS